MGFGFKSARHTATARSAQKLSTLPVVCLQAVAGHLDDARVVVALGSSPEAREALRLGVAAARAAAAAAANKKRRELEQEAAERWWNEVHPRIQAMQNGEPLPPHYPSIMELVTMARREMRPQMPYRKGLQVAVWGFAAFTINQLLLATYRGGLLGLVTTLACMAGILVITEKFLVPMLVNISATGPVGRLMFLGFSIAMSFVTPIIYDRFQVSEMVSSAASLDQSQRTSEVSWGGWAVNNGWEVVVLVAIAVWKYSAHQVRPNPHPGLTRPQDWQRGAHGDY